MKKVFELTLLELEEMIEGIVDKKIKDYLNVINEYNAQSQQLYTTKEVCKELKISRQTLHNWKHSELHARLIENCCKKLGAKLYWDLIALKEVINKDRILFGRDRDYKYKSQANKDEYAELRKSYNQIEIKLRYMQPVTAEEQKFHDNFEKLHYRDEEI